MHPGHELLALRLGADAYALESGRDYVIGSSPDCDIRVAGIATRHARIAVSDTSAEVVDLGSPFGTMCNGQRCTQALLTVGDRLRLGRAELEVIADDGSARFVPVPALRAEVVARRAGEVRLAAAALRQGRSETFAGLVADELGRAPWLGLSLAMHAVLLLLLWALLPTPEADWQVAAVHQLSRGPEPRALPAGPPPPPEIATEPPLPEVALELLAAPADAAPPAEPFDALPPRASLPASNERVARGPPPTAAGPAGELGSLGSPAFQHTVAELRRSGLELVFVVDSTGSMSRTIAATKQTIADMLNVLGHLVPDARIGIVAYRDRGRREAYLTKQVPLDVDPWRARNFVQFLTAEGGGDRPEDVLAGLQAAFQQPWSKSAKRVVVLAGDAPAHDRDWSQLLTEVRRFAADGRSVVHALVTSPDRAGSDTRQQFAAIAAAGRGICEDLEQGNRVLQRVLALAFGREFEGDLQAVSQWVGGEHGAVDARSLFLARQGGRDLERELRRSPVPLPVWNALVKRPRRGTVLQLIDLLVAADTPTHTRHAVAAALQHILDLALPPIDPELDTADRRAMEPLRRAARGLPE